MNKVVSLIIIGILLQGCASGSAIKVDIAADPEKDKKYSSFIEQKLGETAYYYMILNYRLVDEPSLYNRLEKLGTRLTKYAERENLKYRYVVIDSKYRNAFALPDGYIIFTNSMIDTLKNDEKIQAIIAHEVAHINHKHGLKTYEGQQGTNAVEVFLGGRMLDIAIKNKYAKSQEFQADQTAARYLYRAGLNMEVMLDALEDLKKIVVEDEKEAKKDEKENDDKKDEELQKDLISSHPYIENRIVNYKNYMQKVKETEKVLYKPEDFSF